jgi:DNA segregation ATPase FtsK/SpoIIIE, S-DNA-T family
MSSSMSSVTDLIAQVAVHLINNRIDADDAGTARFVLSKLQPAHVAAIARAIASNPALSAKIEVRLPRQWLQGQTLPAQMLTDERATFHRNEQFAKPALLLADIGDDEGQSLRDLTAINSEELMGSAETWLQVITAGLSLPTRDLEWWRQALRGLNDLRVVTSLEMFAGYVQATRSGIHDDGLPIANALGAALPALAAPKHSTVFDGIAEKLRGQKAKWRDQFAKVFDRYRPYLEKYTHTNTLLSDEALRSAFEKLKDTTLPLETHGLIESFLAAPPGWNPAAAALSNQEWETISPLFDGLDREKYNLGLETLAFFDDREPELLSAEEREYLQGLAKRKASAADSDEDRDFYERHRERFKEKPMLRGRWDQFVIGTPKECDDFLVGLAETLKALDWNQLSGSGLERKLTIRTNRRIKKDLRTLNGDAGTVFARRYNGFHLLTAPFIVWDVGELFDFPSLLASWKQSAVKDYSDSSSRVAQQIEFTLELQVSNSVTTERPQKARFVWRHQPLWVSSAFADDWVRLTHAPLARLTVQRDTSNARGTVRSVDLQQVNTLVASANKDRGSLVGHAGSTNDLGKEFLDALDASLAEDFIDRDAHTALHTAFNAFRTSYSAAIVHFLEVGVAQGEVLEQVQRYGELLESLVRLARGDTNRQRLLRPILEIGTVRVMGGKLAAIIPPWHPLRLAAMQAKTARITGLLQSLLTSAEVKIGDSNLFYNELTHTLEHAFYPEVTISWNQEQHELLALTDTLWDYSLHEPPMAGEQTANEFNENPSEGATRVLELVQRYLALYPHERANLSVLLYNCDSAMLPIEVVKKLSKLSEDDGDARCQVVLRHREGTQLRALYERIVNLTEEGEEVTASEASRDFMARLRIGIMADQAPPPDARDGFPQDIVFSQDVIARHARLAWFNVDAQPIALAHLNPASYSRRQPSKRGDRRSVVYLYCPAQSQEGWAYLSALATFFNDDWNGSTTHRLLPARQLDFRDNVTSEIFKETHDLGMWVVNHDELLDRRQLQEQNVSVIRYKQTTTQGRNLVISSRADLGLLRAMVVQRLHSIQPPGLDQSQLRELAQKLIDDASMLSGDIVMRAARRGNAANELIGVVLSSFLAKWSVRPQPLGWFFLDDYASWLGQREGQIADLLALSPERLEDGSRRLTITVTEAKFIDPDGLVSKRKESARQLLQTLERCANALHADVPRLDREVWLARLSDMLIDGCRELGVKENLAHWREALRAGQCQIELRGFSHVFLHTPSNTDEAPSAVRLLSEDDRWIAEQTVYPASSVAELLTAFYRESPPPGIDIPADQQPETRTSDQPTANSVPTIDPMIPRPTPEREPTVSSPEDTLADAHNRPARWADDRIEDWVRRSSAHDNNESSLEWLRSTEQSAKSALQGFKLQAKLLSSRLTPNAVLLRFQGSALLTVKEVLARRSEFLTTYGLNIIGVQPEPGALALSIARDQREIVSLPALWQRWHPDATAGNQTLLIGVREDNGELFTIEPGSRHAPHTLIAGATGSGKSVLLQTILLALIATNRPDQARITLIDPKQGVDYFAFEGVPHLDGGLIDRQEVALERINTLVETMEDRYRRFREVRANNLKTYNSKVALSERMPTLWLVHDEFADWMLDENYKAQVVSAVARLGVKARAAGIHLIFAAQRPDATVMPLQLRDNLGNRLILRVNSEGTSDIALGERGAERLLGRGHLLARLDGENGLLYGQVPFISDQEVDELIQSCILGNAAVQGQSALSNSRA